MVERALSPSREQLLARESHRPPAETPVVRVPIRIKITLPFIILALLLAIGAAYLVTQIVFDTIEQRFTNQLIEGGKLASEWMVREEDRLLETLRLLAYTQGLGEALAGGDADRLRALTFGAVVNNQEEAVAFLSADGEVLLSMYHRPGGRVEEYEFARGGNSLVTSSQFVQDVLDRQADEWGDKYAGVVPEDRQPYFYVAGPVLDGQGDFVGVILVGKSLPTLVRQMREETLAQITLYEFDGLPLASTFFTPATLEAEEVDGVLTRQDEGSRRRDVEAQRDLTVSNIDYVEILGPWEMRGDVDLGVMGVSLPKTFLVTASNITRIKVFLLVVGAFGLVLGLGIQVANLITQPLLGLVQASTQVAQGDLGVQVQASSQDEVAVLADTFNHMIRSLQRSQEELLEAYDSTIEGWSRALDLRDHETEGHSQRVTELTVRLAQTMGIRDEELLHVRRGALLHDIGKMGIPDGILRKEGPLDQQEWEIMRRHPEYAYEMLWPIEYLRPALDIPYCHHEKWDGSGYPRGLKGEEIPLSARIFAIVDVWDALCNDRPYRKSLPEEQVIEILRQDIGRHFDPKVAQVFLDMMQGERG